MKVLVTGVSGRLGPFVVKDLEAAGHDLVLSSRREPGEEIQNWPWVQGDINNFEDCQRMLASGGLMPSNISLHSPGLSITRANGLKLRNEASPLTQPCAAISWALTTCCRPPWHRTSESS